MQKLIVNHYNGHRADKMRLDISLTKEEQVLWLACKKLLGGNNKELLLKLCAKAL